MYKGKYLKGIILLIGLGSQLCSADYLHNHDFSKAGKNGVPAGWKLRDTPRKKGTVRSNDKPAVTVKEGVLKLDPGQRQFEVMLIQFGVGLKPGKAYNLSFKVQSSKGAGYRVVVFWLAKDKKTGKSKWHNTSGSWCKTNGKWNESSIRFSLPGDSRTVYMYLAATGDGPVYIKGLKLEDAGIALSSDNELSVFAPGEEVKYRIRNLFSPENKVSYKVFDFDSKVVVSGGKVGLRNIILKDLPLGYYQLSAVEVDKLGKRKKKVKYSFAVIPKVPAAVAKSSSNRYGAMVNPHTNYPLSQCLMDAKFMNRIGVKYVRTHRLNWCRSQSGPGKPFDWRYSDSLTAIYRKYGLKQIATTGWPTPVWASDAKGTKFRHKGNFAPKPEFMTDYQRFYTEMARRYGDDIAYYEIGNEVDASNFWMGKLANAVKGDDNAIFQDYVDYYIAIAKAIKTGDPDSKVGPGTTGAMPEGHTYKPWLKRFWKSSAVKYTDIFCPHYSADMTKIRQVMKKYGKEVPIVITEIGGLVKTETYEITPEIQRQLIKRTYAQFIPQLNNGAKAVCRFLLRKIPETREGWVSEMLDADFTIRPGYVAYATLIRLTGAGTFKKELNLKSCSDSGWVEAYLIEDGRKNINAILLNDTNKANVSLRTSAPELKVIDVMGRERVFKTSNGKITLKMQEDLPLFVIGKLIENPGPVKHPEPTLVSVKKLNIKNSGFDALPVDGLIPGWKVIHNEENLSSGKENSFKVIIDDSSKKRSIRMSSDSLTKWYGIFCDLPISKIPKLKTGQYLIFKISYEQKAENVVGTGAGLTLGFRRNDMKRVSFAGGNWNKGSFDWTRKTWTSNPYTSFHRDCKRITLEFYLGIATGKVWIDNVKVEVEVWQKCNAGASYIN